MPRPRSRRHAGCSPRPPSRGSAGGIPRDLRLPLPVEHLGEGGELVRGLGRALGAAVGELGGRPGPHHRQAGRGLRRARHPLRDRRQRARVRTPRIALQRAAADRPRGPARQAPEADADDARAALPRDRRRRRPEGHGDPGRAARRPDLLGEHDAARPLRGLSRRAADLARADRRRLRRLARQHAPHRDRVRRLRGLGAPVHPGERLPEPTSRCRFPRARRCSATAAPRSSSRTRAR